MIAIIYKEVVTYGLKWLLFPSKGKMRLGCFSYSSSHYNDTDFTVVRALSCASLQKPFANKLKTIPRSWVNIQVGDWFPSNLLQQQKFIKLDGNQIVHAYGTNAVIA